MRDIKFYKDEMMRGWKGGCPETECGAGSTMENTEPQRKWIPEVIEKYGIKSIIDIGCGDQKWIKTLNLEGYQGYDLLPRNKDVIEFNIIQQVPPKVDLIMCLWVLNHMEPDEMKLSMDNIKASGSVYLMMTHKEKYIETTQLCSDMIYIESVKIPNQKEAEIRLYVL